MKKAFEPCKLPLNLSNDILVELYKKAITARNKLVEFSVLLERNLTSENIMWMLSLNESNSRFAEGIEAGLSEATEGRAMAESIIAILRPFVEESMTHPENMLAYKMRCSAPGSTAFTICTTTSI